ncbi:MAG TPA: DUF2239 family protein [Thermoanaerobaculia bacterium]|nr:DUF2239 family protein [Thermoanaerobaculia bacterium]
MASRKKSDDAPPERQPRKTQKVNVWVLPDQLEWLKNEKGGPSAAVRALITEAMAMEKLKLSVKKKKDGARVSSTARRR